MMDDTQFHASLDALLANETIYEQAVVGPVSLMASVSASFPATGTSGFAYNAFQSGDVISGKRLLHDLDAGYCATSDNLPSKNGCGHQHETVEENAFPHQIMLRTAVESVSRNRALYDSANSAFSKHNGELQGTDGKRSSRTSPCNHLSGTKRSRSVAENAMAVSDDEEEKGSTKEARS